MKAIVVHGGAGSFESEEDHRNHKRGISEALEAGFSMLDRRKSSIEGVVAAVKKMEEDPAFNCGKGSVLNLKGEVEMDAAIMDSELNAGAVSGLKRILHPIEVARAVMEQTDNVLLSGQEVEEFIRIMGFPREENLVVPTRQMQWQRNMEKIERGENLRFSRTIALARKTPGYYSTSGAVAIDDNGKMAAATSTGGIVMKTFGRVGDTPVIGAGTYANNFGAVSATGHGEKIIKLTLCRLVAFFMEQYPAQKAVDLALERAKYIDCECGLIAIDRYANIGIGYTTRDMSWAYAREGHKPVTF
ncbi:MAG: isoaspartyl peptidase/L-asparaginase [Mesotoga sp.]